MQWWAVSTTVFLVRFLTGFIIVTCCVNHNSLEASILRVCLMDYGFINLAIFLQHSTNFH